MGSFTVIASRVGVALLLFAFCAQLSGAEKTVEVRKQDFSSDPKWDGLSNRLLPSPLPGIKQDFGPSETGHAGGKQKGEIGGRVQRSSMLCSYAAKIEPRTLNDRLSASGRFAVTADEGGTGVLFGWFNSAESRGWRTNNSLALRLDGSKGKYWVHFEYGSRQWMCMGRGCFEGERLQTTKTRPLAADGTSHQWSMNYDPAGAAGNGLITFVLDGESYQLPLERGVKADGATFDRFGMFNQMTFGGVMEAYFDDIELDGKPLDDFGPDANWEGRNNRGEFRERIVSGGQDFGYSPETAYAGGKPGELGGVIWRSATRPAYYADRVGPLTLDDELLASGRIALRGGGADSGVYIGWFNSESRRAKTKEDKEQPHSNVLGFCVEGSSPSGQYFRPVYRTATGAGSATDSGPFFRPDGSVHRWSLYYGPLAANGRGRISVVFDGREQWLDLPDGHRKQGGTFDRFGIFCQPQGGDFVEVYLDDLQYTAGHAAKTGDQN